jgi:hypothetical protein
MMNVYETCHVTRVTETCVCAHAQTHSHLRYRMCLISMLISRLLVLNPSNRVL